MKIYGTVEIDIVSCNISIESALNFHITRNLVVHGFNILCISVIPLAEIATLGEIGHLTNHLTFTFHMIEIKDSCIKHYLPLTFHIIYTYDCTHA